MSCTWEVVIAALVGLIVSLMVASANAGTTVRQKTDMIVVHHSETESGNVEVFRDYHINHNGWDDIGYHYVITNGNGGLDGEIQTGRREDLQGAHAANSGPNRNARSVGICLVGTDTFTDAQIASLVTKLIELCRKYEISPSVETIQPHHDKCPGPVLGLDKVIELVKQKLAKDRPTTRPS